ncbi:glucose dehydrogenase [FAD, quinone]-like [Pectinophora gossypiella]|uniref:glucose dehydrogenase [FAD, quinone]-like n=1 Tax=Pectinophora gossypiella TaxID=13191 RepID=UPI00214F31C0|nr:glucose dehydrogenase [FAD, quinone]-like [Pectinophora gossypiella]
MEALQMNLTAACPLPFSGATGNLFASAITAVVAAHCAFYDNTHWPRDSALEVIGRRAEPVSFDFIIVGAGTAGSLLANRLANEYPSQSVLLVEAGDDPGLNSEVPGLAFINGAKENNDDWHYVTEPDQNCKGFRENRCVWSKGKGIGGSGAINAMLYIRGHPTDYNNWEKAGNEGWSYKDVSPLFDKIENEFEFSKYSYPENPWHGVLEASWTELNMTQHKRSSNEGHLGIRLNKLLVKEGRRFNTARFYLKGIENVSVMKNTLAQKLTIDPTTKTVTGIEIRHKSGVVMEIKANKEVILSAGSIATPQLLMLSGIGPKKHLEEKGIKCLVDLPVGQNLQDHVLLPLYLKTKLDTVLTPETITTYFLQYMLTRTGPLSNIGVTDFMAFVNTKNQKYPDLQFLHTYFTMKDNFAMRPFLEGYGYKEEIIKEIERQNMKSDLLALYPNLLHPKSKGEVLLADTNPASKPIIKANYFQHPDDLTVLLKSIEYIKKLEGTTVYKALGIGLLKLDIENCVEDSDDYWECYARHMASSIFHPVGTTKMGPDDDETAVVDTDLLVRGVKKLRVVDASIMPDIPGGNTMGPTLMIAEKAAQIIKNHYGYKDEL